MLIGELNDVMAQFESDSNSYEGVTEERPNPNPNPNPHPHPHPHPNPNPNQERVSRMLSEASLSVFDFLPDEIRKQLLLDRDPHGNVQVGPLTTPTALPPQPPQPP